jgi:hypothetical protein
MKNGTATSYYGSEPKNISILNKINILERINYWKIVPILKLLKRKRYQREALLLIESGLIQSMRGRVPVRYVIKNKTSRFDISPDQGKTYLNYLRGKLSDNSKEDLIDIVNAIATIEARIRTKAYKIY